MTAERASQIQAMPTEEELRQRVQDATLAGEFYGNFS